jgi:hypothetical protein
MGGGATRIGRDSVGSNTCGVAMIGQEEDAKVYNLAG